MYTIPKNNFVLYNDKISNILEIFFDATIENNKILPTKINNISNLKILRIVVIKKNQKLTPSAKVIPLNIEVEVFN